MQILECRHCGKISWVISDKTTVRETPGASPGNEDDHYQGEIQPIDFIEAQGLDFLEGNIVKYVSRYKRKGGLEDLKKAAWYLDRLIKRESK